MLAIVIAIVVSLFMSPVASPTPEQCAEINTLLGGETIPWLGYEQGGWDLPADIDRVAHIDFAEGGLWVYESKTVPDKRWYWWFFSYDATTDANGNHLGSHDFCATVVND